MLTKLQSKVRTLIIPAAGAGTRLHPMTKIVPKELQRLADKPVLYYLLAEAHQAGIRKVVFIIHPEGLATKRYLLGLAGKALLAEFRGLEVSFITIGKRGGDGQAILAARRLIEKEGVFAISMGDLLAAPGASLLAELIRAHVRVGGPIISVERAARAEVSNYGVIIPGPMRERICQVLGIEEKPKPREAPSNLITTGKYLLHADILEDLTAIAKEVSVESEEAKLVHALNRYAHRRTLYAYLGTKPHYDVGNKPGLFRSEIAFSLAHPTEGKRMRAILRAASKGIG